MNRTKTASTIAALALSIAAVQIGAAGAAGAATTPRDCATWIDDGQTGNVTCTKGGPTSRFRAEVTCITNSGSTFVVYGQWVHEGVSYAACSLNGSAGVAHIGWKFGNKG